MTTDKLKGYTEDLYTLLKHTQNVVRKQKNSDKLSHSKAVNLLHQIDISLSNQINHIESNEDWHEDDLKSSIKEKLGSLTGKIAGYIDSAREDAESKMLRDDYTALSFIATGYTMLHTAALAADEAELASFSNDSLTTIAGLITETSRIIPHVVAEEIGSPQIAEKAEENTQRSWKPENMMEEA
ncbi:hypothetical protein AB2B38_012770 [Balneola sp. MJW-20]|uniref:hypothetical protein n=1 Tax=Gracilimonas aurantiaca TaxID=3234185 RepID=UPI0034673A81